MPVDIPDEVFRSMGFDVHHWTMSGAHDVVVLHNEPFRVEWFLTKLVTFLFLVRRGENTVEELERDFDELLTFAKRHKQTWLPRGIHCGYALLPIYLGSSFDDDLKRHVRALPKKRWCVTHVPSLFDLETATLTTLTRMPIWGRIYADYIYRTIAKTTQVLVVNAALEADPM